MLCVMYGLGQRVLIGLFSPFTFTSVLVTINVLLGTLVVLSYCMTVFFEFVHGSGLYFRTLHVISPISSHIHNCSYIQKYILWVIVTEGEKLKYPLTCTLNISIIYLLHAYIIASPFCFTLIVLICCMLTACFMVN